MRIPTSTSVIRIYAHLDRNAYMREQATIGFGIALGEEVPKLVYAFWMCKPVVSFLSRQIFPANFFPPFTLY